MTMVPDFKRAQAMLLEAILAGDVPGVEAAVRQGADVTARLPTVPAEAALPPAHLAASRWDAPVLKALHHAGADLSAACDASGISPLMRAACARNTDCARFETLLKDVFLPAGVDINQSNAEDCTAAHLPVQPEILRVLIENGADVLARNMWGHTVAAAVADRLDTAGLIVLRELGLALSGENAADRELAWHATTGASYQLTDAEVVDPEETLARFDAFVTCLREHGLGLSDPVSGGSTPLHAAAECADIRLLRRLLGHGVAVDARNDDGRTPVMSAAAEGLEQHVALLAQHGADVAAVDEYGANAAHYAATSTSAGAEDRAALFRRLHALGTPVDIRDGDGLSPLHRLACEGHPATIAAIVALGAGVESRSGSGLTALMYAVLNARPDAVRALLETGADPLVRADDGDTVLHRIAYGHGRPVSEAAFAQTVRLCVDAGAPLNAVNKRGETAIFSAIRCNRAAHVRILIEAGVDASIPDKFGRTPLNALRVDGAPSAEAYGELLAVLTADAARRILAGSLHHPNVPGW